MSIAAAVSNSARTALGRQLAAVCCLVLIAGCTGSPGQQGSTANSETPARGAHKQRSPATARRLPTPLQPTRLQPTPPRPKTAARLPGDDAPVASPSAVDAQLQEDLIRSVIDNFNRLDEFDPSQILPQLKSRLNQWMWQSRHKVVWQRDPLLDTLDESLSASPASAYSLKNLDTGLFTLNDMIGLQESIWLRDIAKNARGNQLDDLSIAESLFDWTVRNIQLVEDPPAGTPASQNSATEILLLGRGTTRERAWIFLLLLRQQGLDGVMLAIPGRDGPATASRAANG